MRVETPGGEPLDALAAFLGADEQANRTADDPLLTAGPRVHQPGEPDSRLADDPGQARLREKGIAPSPPRTLPSVIRWS